MSKKITVHKFGGSCLRDISDLNRIAEVIRFWPGQSVIVVSALWGTTDRLMRASQEPRYASRLVNDLSRQHLRFAPGILESENGGVFNAVLNGIEQALEILSRNSSDWKASNRLLAAGERLSALVVAHRLQECGIQAHPVGAEDISLKLKGSNRAPVVDLESSMKELDRTALYGTPVITGWFGEGSDGELALLGRGGSDHTATSIAHLIDADRVILWKDVDGVLPLNPRWGIQSSPIPYLGYGEAIELARLDTPVLHPATVEPLRSVGIPLEIRDLRGVQSTKAATIIGPDLHQTRRVKAIGCLPNIVRIRARAPSLESQNEQLGRVLIEFAHQNIPCWHLDSTHGEIAWVLSQHDIGKANSIVSAHFSTPETEEYGVMFSLVGNKLPEDSELSIIHEIQTLLDVEVLSATDHAIRLLSKKKEIHSMLEVLAEYLNLSIEV